MGEAPLPGGLVEHLRDAVALNRSRRAGYRQRGGLRADALSRALVAAERALLPAAVVLDRHAAPFVARGVPILVGDLAPLTDVPAAARPIALAADAVGHDAPDLAGPLAAARRALQVADFRVVAEGLRSVLLRVREAEGFQSGGADPHRYLALTRHVLESAGWMAERGLDHAARTDGETAPLTCRLVRGHLALLPAALRLDRAARPLHARGVGLFVNDLPPIPFSAAHG